MVGIIVQPTVEYTEEIFYALIIRYIHIGEILCKDVV